jgi:hypothetical protein
MWRTGANWFQRCAIGTKSSNDDGFVACSCALGVAPRGAFDTTPLQFRLHDLAHCEAQNLPSSSALLFRFFAGKFVRFVFLLVSHGAYICVGTKHDTLTFALLVYSDKLEQGYENRRPQVILATLVAGLILYHRKWVKVESDSSNERRGWQQQDYG